MSEIFTALTSLVSILRTAMSGIVGFGWVVAVPASFFVIGLGVKFIFGLMGRGKKRRGR